MLRGAFFDYVDVPTTGAAVTVAVLGTILLILLTALPFIDGSISSTQPSTPVKQHSSRLSLRLPCNTNPARRTYTFSDIVNCLEPYDYSQYSLSRPRIINYLTNTEIIALRQTCQKFRRNIPSLQQLSPSLTTQYLLKTEDSLRTYHACFTCCTLQPQHNFADRMLAPRYLKFVGMDRTHRECINCGIPRFAAGQTFRIDGGTMAKCCTCSNLTVEYCTQCLRCYECLSMKIADGMLIPATECEGHSGDKVHKWNWSLTEKYLKECEEIAAGNREVTWTERVKRKMFMGRCAMFDRGRQGNGISAANVPDMGMHGTDEGDRGRGRGQRGGRSDRAAAFMRGRGSWRRPGRGGINLRTPWTDRGRGTGRAA